MTTSTGETRIRFKGWWRMVPSVTALTALALTACASEDEPAEFEDAAEADQTEEDTEQQTDGGTSADDAEGEPSEDDPATAEDAPSDAEDVSLDPDEALQTQTYAIAHEEGEVDGEMTVGVHSVTVEEETMLLQLSFTPEYEEPEDGPLQFNALHARGQNLGNAQWLRPIIADRENLKSHHVLDWGGAASHDTYWMTMVGYSGDGLFAPAGQTVPFFAYFAAPQDPIDQVDVSLPEIGVSFESVELTEGDA